MAGFQKRQWEANDAIEVLNDILITQLGLGGVPRQIIRKIVGCSTNCASPIVKHLKSAERGQVEPS